MTHDRTEAAPGAAFFSPSNARAVGAFSARVREHTRTLHRDAERSGFVRIMLQGAADRSRYCLWLRNLHPVYEALEGEISALRRNVHAAPFADDALHRARALASDLEAICGPAWPGLQLLPAARAYVDAIRACARSPRLLGHAYSRYLGDLSGGQVLSGLVARQLDLSPSALQYYAFPGVGDVGTRRTALRAALDDGLRSEGEIQAALEGAAEGFVLSTALSLAVASAAV